MSQSMFEQTRPDDYLVRLAASDLGHSYKALAAAELDISSGHTVVDLGCGPGADLPAFADAVGTNGHVIGFDHDRALLDRAVASTDTIPQIKVHECDVHALDLPDNSVDRAHTDRVVQHLADPARALAEIRRVLRPGGRVLFAEPDWDTLIIDYPELSVARSYSRYVSDCVVRNACIGRQLPGLVSRTGLTVDKVIPITTVFSDARSADQVLGLHRVTKRAVAAEYLSEDIAERWLSYLATEPFFAAATLFMTLASKPAEDRQLGSNQGLSPGTATRRSQG